MNVANEISTGMSSGRSVWRGRGRVKKKRVARLIAAQQITYAAGNS